MKATTGVAYREGTQSKVNYHGLIVDDDIYIIWKCQHKHKSRQTAKLCAESELLKLIH